MTNLASAAPKVKAQGQGGKSTKQAPTASTPPLSEATQEKNTPKVVWGDVISHAEEHIPVHELERMRLEKDDLGDHMLEVLLERNPSLLGQKGAEGLKSALEYEYNAYLWSRSESGKGTQTAVSASASASASASIKVDPRSKAFFDSVCTSPSWLDKAVARDGQLTYLRYFTSAALGLTYYSLVGGFSAPKIVAVLDRTGYLTRAARDDTWKRLNETFEMVVDIMSCDDSLDVGKIGWWTILKVRMLHSRVRRRIMGPQPSSSASSLRAGAGGMGTTVDDADTSPAATATAAAADSPTSSKRGRWDTEQYGLPINQEDMVGTLLSFSVNVIKTIKKIGGPWLSASDTHAYIHMWRYIGHLIGVREEFNPCTSTARALGAIESVVMHLLHPTERSQEVASHVLQAMAGRKFGSMRYGWTLIMHEEMALSLLGADLGKALGVGKGPEFQPDQSMFCGLIPASKDRLRIRLFLLVFFVINCIAPLLLSRDTAIGRYLVARLRGSMRESVNVQLYPERYAQTQTQTQTQTIISGQTANPSPSPSPSPLEAKDGIASHENRGAESTAAAAPTCPFGFGAGKVPATATAPATADAARPTCPFGFSS